jgi:cobalamin biosynthetic protein CobC
MVHGGRTDEARKAYSGAPQPWIDLSTGLNPHSYPMPHLATSDWAALPDQEALAGLEEAAALAFGVPHDFLSVLPGTEIGIRLLASIDLPQPVRIVGPSYGSYADAWPAAMLIEAGEADLELGRGTLVLANPNNPDGRCRPTADLLELADRLASNNGFLVVDEAFVDVAPELSLCPYISDRPNITVLRSFGKFFGLGGVRLGFLISSPGLRSAVRHRLGAWPVSTAAIRVGSQAYEDRAWIERTIPELSADATRLHQMLKRHDLSVRGECPLFRLVETHRASELFTHLARRGILTRPFSYNEDWLRIGLPGSEPAWARFDAALTSAMENLDG